MDSPKFVLDKKTAVRQYQKLRDLRLTVSYSLKTNPEVAVVLEDMTDSLFLVDTLSGLSFLKDYSRVWFIGQALDSKILDDLRKRGIDKFIVDNETDIKTITNYSRKNKWGISLMLRMKMKENTIFTGRYYVFGMDANTVNSWIRKLKGTKNIRELGIHFHRKTQNVSEWSLVRELKESLSEETFGSICLMNIGGGLPVKYKNSSDKSIGHILKSIEETRDWLKGMGISLIIEPGRFIAAPSVKLESRILSVSGKNIIIDCSVYNSAMDTIIAPLKLLVEGEKENGKSYTIKGCTPCSMDIFRYEVKLAKKPKAGDKIVFLNAGAYNFASDFCNLKKPKTVVV